MATIRLVPSTYAVSSSYYLSVEDAENMYHNTDNTTYATITNTYSSTSSRYLYLRGFNFNDIPSGAVINSFTVKIKGYESGLATSTSYAPRLANGSSAIANTTADTNFSTSVHTIEIPTGALTWQQIVNYDDSFTIMVYVRRASRNTTGHFYCYGAEIEVNYTIPDPRTVTTTLNGNGEIDPSGTQTMYDGDEYNLTVIPTNALDEVTATRDGSSITLTKHTGGETTESKVLGEYTLISGSFNSGESFFEGRVGHGYDTDSITTSNYYSSSSSTHAVFQYSVAFEGIPEEATIKSLYMMANGHAESTSQSNEYMCVQLKSGNTNLSSQFNFKSTGTTSNSTQTIEATTLPTVAQLENLVVECTLGYYGGAINGVTVFLTYEVSGVYYTYSTTINGDMAIVVTIGGSGESPKLYFKQDSSETLLFTKTTTGSDSSLDYQPEANVLIPGDNIKVVFENLIAYSSGTSRASLAYDEINITLTNSSQAFYGDSSITCEVGDNFSAMYQKHYYNIGPYYLYNGSRCTFSGTMSIYQLGSTGGGWTLVAKAYKKINGSWVQQSDLTTVFNANTNYVKG